MKSSPSGLVVARDDNLLLFDGQRDQFQGWGFGLEDGRVETIIVLFVYGQAALLTRGVDMHDQGRRRRIKRRISGTHKVYYDSSVLSRRRGGTPVVILHP